MRIPLATLALLIICSLLFQSCDWFCKKSKLTGVVISNSGKPVEDADVTINKAKTKTAKDGTFECEICSKQKDILVTIRKFGFGLFANRFDTAFVDKKIYLTEGTIIEFDPSKKNTLTDKNSSNNPFKPWLLKLADTTQLLGTIPSVYDSEGKFSGYGYPPSVQNIFDYLKMPVGGPGMEVTIPENSLVDENNNPPPPGTMLKIALSTVDFFNPDGMPGDFVVSTDKGPAWMESFGAGTIEISDGTKPYRLKSGAQADVKFPVYPVRLNLKEKLEDKISLLRYSEKLGAWEETGVGTLNKERNAYVGTVDRFSVLNMDMVKTGLSKCFKIRQVVRSGGDNSNNFRQQYRAHVLVPATPTSFFKETPMPIPIDENSMYGCVPAADVNSSSVAFTSRLHTVTRIPLTVPNIVVVFLDNTTNDVLGISIGTPSSGSISAATAVTQARTCSTPCDGLPCPSAAPNPAHNKATAAGSPCNVNTGCWMDQCGFIPFENLNEGMKIVAVPMGGGKVKVKWENTFATTHLKITAYGAASCGGAAIATVVDRCTGGAACTPSVSCPDGDCTAGQCRYGEFIYPAVGTVTGVVSFKIESWADVCSALSAQTPVCSNDVTVIP